MTRKTLSMFDPDLLRPALVDAFRKLNPAVQWRNPVMFVVYGGSLLTTVLGIQALAGDGEAPAGFIFTVALWLWFTVLFANFAEALAEGRSKAQAAALRGLKQDTPAKRLTAPRYGAPWQQVSATALRDNHGNFAGSFAMFSDITAIKQAESALAQADAALARARAIVLEVNGASPFAEAS